MEKLEGSGFNSAQPRLLTRLYKMACNVMPGMNFDKRRLLFGANGPDKSAPRPEMAAGRRVDGAWHIACQDDSLPFEGRIWNRDGRQQGFRIRVEGTPVKRIRIGCFDDLAEIHDRYPAGNMFDDA